MSPAVAIAPGVGVDPSVPFVICAEASVVLFVVSSIVKALELFILFQIPNNPLFL
ncbi:hypothetical protein D3C87_1340760 [compost metagenome]